MSRVDMDLIDKIANRAVAMHQRVSGPDADDKLTWLMDISFGHDSCPLKLAELLEAGDSDFAHDVFGIRRHMNRETCQLGDCFLPRYAQLAKEA